MNWPQRLADRLHRALVDVAHPDELKVGDRVLIECEVYDDPDDYPPGSHVHARPVGAWNAGDQDVWTWTRRQKSRPDPWIVRVSR